MQHSIIAFNSDAWMGEYPGSGDGRTFADEQHAHFQSCKYDEASQHSVLNVTPIAITVYLRHSYIKNRLLAPLLYRMSSPSAQRRAIRYLHG